MTDALPEKWMSLKLGDVVAYGKTEKAEPDQIPGDAWILELEDVERDTSRVLQRQTFAERRSKSTKNRFEKGDVLYGKLRPYLNKVVLADAPGYCTTEIVPLRGNDAIDGRFLFHWLKGPAFMDYVAGVSHGINMPRLGSDAGNSAPLVLAPLAEQKRIADKLDTLLARVDACRDRLDRVSKLLKSFRQSVLSAATTGKLTSDWRDQNVNLPQASEEVLQYLSQRRMRHAKSRKFKEPVAPDLSHWNSVTPDGWSIESVSAYAECLDHLRVPVTKSNRTSTQGLYPYYGANGLVDRVDDYLFDDELVLVTEDETFYGRDKPIAYRVSGRCWVNNHAHVLLADSRNRADYLCYALMHYNVLPWLTGTTGRAKLTQGVLNALPIAVPSNSEIDVIVGRVKTLFAWADRLEANLRTADDRTGRLTPAVLAKAFRGELVPQDPNDEPAAALLARIRESRSPSQPAPVRGRPRKQAV